MGKPIEIALVASSGPHGGTRSDGQRSFIPARRATERTAGAGAAARLIPGADVRGPLLGASGMDTPPRRGSKSPRVTDPSRSPRTAAAQGGGSLRGGRHDPNPQSGRTQARGSAALLGGRVNQPANARPPRRGLGARRKGTVRDCQRSGAEARTLAGSRHCSRGSLSSIEFDAPVQSTQSSTFSRLGR